MGMSNMPKKTILYCRHAQHSAHGPNVARETQSFDNFASFFDKNAL